MKIAITKPTKLIIISALAVGASLGAFGIVHATVDPSETLTEPTSTPAPAGHPVPVPANDGRPEENFPALATPQAAPIPETPAPAESPSTTPPSTEQPTSPPQAPTPTPFAPQQETPDMVCMRINFETQEQYDCQTGKTLSSTPVED